MPVLGRAGGAGSGFNEGGVKTVSTRRREAMNSRSSWHFAFEALFYIVTGVGSQML